MYTGSIFYEIVTDWAEPFVKYYKILLNYPIFFYKQFVYTIFDKAFII